MTLKNQINALKTSLQTDIPALLTAAGLDAFDEYVTGDPTKTEKVSCAVYPAPYNNNINEETQEFIVELQLYRKQYIDSVDYIDVFRPYLLAYNAENLGLLELDRLTEEAWPPVNNATTFIFYNLVYRKDLDDCD